MFNLPGKRKTGFFWGEFSAGEFDDGEFFVGEFDEGRFFMWS